MSLIPQAGPARHSDAQGPASRAPCAALAVAALIAALPAFAITPTANSVGSVRTVPRQATATMSTVSRDGVVQAFDAAGQTIVINAARYKIGPPLLALLDKRPKSNGLLKFTDLKVGMVVRYRVENERVVELWVMRDPPSSGAHS
jgi:hypothetical protein